MKVWDRIKNFFKKEVKYLGKEELDSIFDHPEVDFDAAEFARIDESFMMYSGDYEPVTYLNSMKQEKKRPYMHLNMLSVISKHVGGLLFNEEAEIKIDGHEGKNLVGKDGKIRESQSDSKIDKEFIEHVLEHNDFNKNFSQYIQVMLATGGLAVKPYYDHQTKEFEFSWALADAFIPLRSNTNNISEAVIPSYTQIVEGDKTYFYTLLEFHEWNNGLYTIANELYRSEDADVLGKQVNLAEVYEELEPVTIYKNFSRPNFSYLRPNGFNNINPQSPLGLGIADNAKTTLKQINDTYDQFHWEIKQGKRKVIVSDHFLKTRIDGAGRPIQYFDDDTDTFLGLPGGGMDEMVHKDLTADIRSQQYIESINKFVSTLEMQVGLSSGTFAFDGASMKTATEVVSENSLTFRTRNSHLTNVSQFITELIISLCELARETYDENGQPLYRGEIPTAEQIEVDFDDGIFEDRSSKLEYVGKAVTLGLMPTTKGIQEIFDLSEEDAAEWFRAILDEQQGKDPNAQQDKVEGNLFGGLE